ncbi:MAG: hypothetical protein QWI73_05575 [Alphaproteobacteria bacterium]|nr:hypothetical protein [Alphaproteobacteria bacterium]
MQSWQLAQKFSQRECKNICETMYEQAAGATVENERQKEPLALLNQRDDIEQRANYKIIINIA